MLTIRQPSRRPEMVRQPPSRSASSRRRLVRLEPAVERPLGLSRVRSSLLSLKKTVRVCVRNPLTSVVSKRASVRSWRDSPAGNPEKESRDMLDRNPSISHEKEDGGSTPSMSAGKQDKGVLLPSILGLARFTRGSFSHR